jgi:hypothetical protein
MIIVIGDNNIMKLIDKSALVAEIKKIYNEDYKFLPSDIAEHIQDFKDDVLINIGTIEVKEVDFAKEFYAFSEKYKLMDKGIEFADIEKTASFFFQLGLKASNPITAAYRGIVEEVIINLKRIESDYRINLTREIEWLRNKVKKGEDV